MKNCEAGHFCNCGGHSTETKHYEVYSGDIEPEYPERFWGVVAYCELAYEAEEAKGYNLLEVEEQRTYTL
ncbi:hypothetical protein [Paenibacillus sp. FSL H3-0333]|uniref:hypothetical protein n=1 Tax=Paenibacillus sp. FSL H3-0333 TaxID=2921373 RepID=UPI0030FA7997